MSPAERSVRHHKVITDHAISRAYARLAHDVRARATFSQLLQHVRQRGPRLLDAPTADGRHLGVEALSSLARMADSSIRSIHSWPGCTRSWRPSLGSLAQHLFARYDTPGFLCAAWYAIDPYAESKRRWFIAHGNGASFRSLRLPIRLTRKMEHFLLDSPDHFEIEYALRRAELLGLGASTALTEAVLATRAALELAHGEFWRTAWRFLIAHADSIDVTQVGPIIDFFHGVRHARAAIETSEGLVYREPLQPHFSLQGRTARSVMRLMDEWHRSLGLAAGGLSWTASRFRPWLVEAPSQDPSIPPILWEITELTNSAQLRLEGARLRHCVASYGHACWVGRSRIFSLRRGQATKRRSIATIEVDPRDQTVVQASGFRNRRPSARTLRFIQQWAARERLRMSLIT